MLTADERSGSEASARSTPHSREQDFKLSAVRGELDEGADEPPPPFTALHTPIASSVLIHKVEAKVLQTSNPGPTHVAGLLHTGIHKGTDRAMEAKC